jgi:hypothetical protein
MTSRYTILSRVVESIAEAEGCAPHELDYSLYEYVDTDALVTLAASEHTDWQLTFRIPDHTVEIHGTGEVFVDDALYRKLEEPTRTE